MADDIFGTTSTTDATTSGSGSSSTTQNVYGADYTTTQANDSSTSSTAAWDPAQAYLESVLGSAAQTAASQSDDGSNWAHDTAYNMLANNASGYGTSMSNYYSDVGGAGGYTNEQADAATVFDAYAAGYGQDSNSSQNLQKYADGTYLSEAGTDENFLRLLETATQEAANQANLLASGSGRYGGARHTGAVTRSVGDVQAEAYMNELEKQRQYQFAANDQIDKYLQQNYDRQLAAARDQFNASQQAYENVATSYDYMNKPAETMEYIADAYYDNAWDQQQKLADIYTQIGSTGSETDSSTYSVNNQAAIAQAVRDTQQTTSENSNTTTDTDNNDTNKNIFSTGLQILGSIF